VGHRPPPPPPSPASRSVVIEDDRFDVDTQIWGRRSFLNFNPVHEVPPPPPPSVPPHEGPPGARACHCVRYNRILSGLTVQTLTLLVGGGGWKLTVSSPLWSQACFCGKS